MLLSEFLNIASSSSLTMTFSAGSAVANDLLGLLDLHDSDSDSEQEASNPTQLQAIESKQYRGFCHRILLTFDPSQHRLESGVTGQRQWLSMGDHAQQMEHKD